MAVETTTILKGVYRSLLLSETLEQARASVRDIMDERDAAYVEKAIEKLREKEGK
jgi:hypothetical protein